MEITPKAQTVELIKQSENILILTHEDPDGDAIASSLALRAALKKLKKQADSVFYGNVGEVFSFLPGFAETQSSPLSASNDLVVTIDTRSTGEDLQLGYKKFPDEHRIKIVITPPKGSLSPEDVTLERSRPKYDLVIVLDTGTIDRLGQAKQELADLLYEVPTISIDHHVDNSHFAKINWVDMTATSTAEILVSLIESLSRDEPLLDADIATSLLTGLITDTGSFQYSNTTPKSLTVAAQLVAAGARQQEIIERIFRTITMSRLKLMGRMFAKVKVERDNRFLWTTITKEDLVETGAGVAEITGLVNELQKSVGDVDFALLLSDRDGTVYGSFRSINSRYNVSELAHLFDGGGHKQAAAFRLEGTIAEKQGEILKKLREHQQRRIKSTQRASSSELQSVQSLEG